MVWWIAIKPDLLPKIILTLMVETILRYFLQLLDELHQDSIISGCQSIMALVSVRCQECLLIWWFAGGSLYGATSRLCCSRVDQSLSSQEGNIWTQAESKGVVWETQFYHFWYWLRWCHSDHSVFFRRTKSGIVVLIAYIDDIFANW